MKKLIKYITFNNGAKLIYRRRKTINATCIYAGFHCGFEYEDENLLGLSHLVEHMLLKGTNKRTRDQIVEDRTNIAYVNAFTSMEFLAVDFYESSSCVKEAFEFASDVLLNSKFDEKVLANEKKIVFEEKQDRENKDKKNIDVQHSYFCHKEYGLNYNAGKHMGTEDKLGKCTITDLNDFKNKHFVSDKFLAVVVTSLPLRKIKKLLKTHFISKLNKPKENFTFECGKIYPVNQEQGLNVCFKDATNYEVKLSIKIDAKEHLSPYDKHYDIISYYLRRNPNLYYNYLRKQGLIYSAGSGLYSNWYKDTMRYNFTFSTSTIDNIDKVLQTIGDSIKELKENGIPQEYLDKYLKETLRDQDLKLPANYETSAGFILDSYIYIDKKYQSRGKKYSINQIKAVTPKSIKAVIDKTFDKNSNIYITIMSKDDKDKFKTIEEYKSMIFKD